MKKALASSVAVLALAVAVPFALGAPGDRHQDHGAHGMHGTHHGSPGGGHRRGHLLDLIERFDADGDGGVSQAEIDVGRAKRLSDFDADGNGELSLEEYEQLWLDAMRDRMVDAFQRHDDDGNGQVTAEEFQARLGRVVALRDRNDDGILDKQDLRRKGRRGQD